VTNRCFSKKYTNPEMGLSKELFFPSQLSFSGVMELALHQHSLKTQNSEGTEAGDTEYVKMNLAYSLH
jgi:hypothetical protein